MRKNASLVDRTAGRQAMRGPLTRTASRLGVLLSSLVLLGAPAFADAREDAKEGRIAFLAKNYDAAIRLTTKAIESDELDNRSLAQAYNVRGVALRRLNLLDQAIADYDEAIRLRPNYAFAYNNRGIALQAKGEYSLAVVDHSQAIAFDPDYANAYAGRCLAYEHLKRKEQAIADCKKALDLDPDKRDVDKALKRLTERPLEELGPLGSGADR